MFDVAKISLLTCTDGAALSEGYVLLRRTFQLCAHHALTIRACANKQSCLKNQLYSYNQSHWVNLLEFQDLEEWRQIEQSLK
jgi:hypothetical protein